MSWQGIEGHDEICNWFRRAMERNRLASTFLFVGPAGVGKRMFALKLAQCLLCGKNRPERMTPCNTCPGCKQVMARTHPDLHLVARPEGKATVPVELLIGDKEHRMQEGLCHDLSLKPYMGQYRIGIIDDADFLSAESANCLLKTLEEPPPQSLLILLGTSAARQLPTIRSRCQVVRFRPLPVAVVAEILLRRGIAEHEDDAQRLAAYSEGSVSQAIELADASWWSFREEMLAQLAARPIDPVQLASSILQFCDTGEKKAANRRRRIHVVLAFAAEFYRRLLRTLAGEPLEGDQQLEQLVEKAARQHGANSTLAIRCLERTLAAEEQLDRNVHPALVVEAWLADLADLQAQWARA